MACSTSLMSSCSSSCAATGTSTAGWASPEGILEATIPGFSVASGFAKSFLHLDLSAILIYLVPIAAVAAAFKYFYDPVSVYVLRYGVSAAEIRYDDDMYNYIMYWLSQQKFAANTLNFIAGTRTSSELSDDYYENDDKSDRVPEIDWALAEESFDEYWTQITNQDRIKPLYFTPRNGTHWFKYRGHYIAFTRSSTEHSYRRMVSRIETLYLSCLGRDATILKELLREAQKSYIERDGTSTVIHRKYPDVDDWQRCMARPPRPLSTVVLDKVQKDAIVEDVREYLHPLTKRWYANRGIPYRRGYLLYGPPGTGKTSLCVALAGMFRLSVYVVSLNSRTLTEEGLASLFANLPSRCVVLLEDVDSAGITHKRGSDSKSGDKDKEDDDNNSSNGSKETGGTGISLSALLNTIDGVASSEGRILIMTTNHVEKLDPALLRPGRVDMSIAFENATSTTAGELFRSTYISRDEDLPPQHTGDSKKLFMKRKFGYSDEEIEKLAKQFASQLPSGEFSPADIQGYLLKHKSTPDKAADGVIEWVHKIREEKDRQKNADKKVVVPAAAEVKLLDNGVPSPPATPLMV